MCREQWARDYGVASLLSLASRDLFTHATSAAAAVASLWLSCFRLACTSSRSLLSSKSSGMESVCPAHRVKAACVTV